MQKSFWRSAIAAIAMVTGLSVSPSSAAIIDLNDFGLQVKSGPVFTFSNPIWVYNEGSEVSGFSSIFSQTSIKKDEVVIGDDSNFIVTQIVRLKIPSTYSFRIFTTGPNGELQWGSIEAPIVVLDSDIERNAIEIIFKIGLIDNPTPGYYPETDYVLMRMDLLGLTGGFGSSLSSLSAIQKLEALASFVDPGHAIIDVDFTITPLEDVPPPPPLTPTVPVPGSGLLILSALAGGAILVRRKRSVD